mmetsp:Transcript_101950/g.288681  ORF Transcript_101950/g.288681 Transcript_101950/m.288681 type:complete len:247 (-) Transcript_101950:176-916(-)
MRGHRGSARGLPLGAGLVRGGVVEGEVGTGAVAAAVAAVLLLVGDPHLHVVGGDGHVAAPEGLEAALPGEGAHLVVVVDHVPPLHLPALQLAHRLQAGPVEPHHQEGQAQQHEAEGRHGGAQAHAEVPPARGDQVEAGHRQAQPEREAGARPPQRGAEVHPLAGRAAGQGRLHLARPEVREEAPLLEEGLRGVHDPPREPRVLCGFATTVPRDPVHDVHVALLDAGAPGVPQENEEAEGRDKCGAQ